MFKTKNKENYEEKSRKLEIDPEALFHRLLMITFLFYVSGLNFPVAAI